MGRKDKTNGLLLGLACGDALGRPVRGWSGDEIAAEYGILRDMVPDEDRDGTAGTVREHTHLAICLGRSLVACDGFEPEHVADRFRDWNATNPEIADEITRLALDELEAGTSWERAGKQAGGETTRHEMMKAAALPRCLPLAIRYRESQLAVTSMRAAQITHADPDALYGAAVLNLAVAGVLDDADTPRVDAFQWFNWDNQTKFDSVIESVRSDTASISSDESKPPVIPALKMAFVDTKDVERPEEAIVTTINRGGPTATTGAITGAIVGARFGASNLPNRWLRSLECESTLRTLATDLIDSAEDE